MQLGREGLSKVMVGRTAELDVLRAAVADEEPSVVLLGGEAGLGKTRLLRELLAHLDDDVTVLAGAAAPGSLDRPFDLVGSVLSFDASAIAEERDRFALLVGAFLDGLAGGRRVLLLEDVHWADAESLEVLDRVLLDVGGPVTVVLTYRPDDLTTRLPAADLFARLERRQTIRHLRLQPLDVEQVEMLLVAISGQPRELRSVQVLHRRTGGNPFFVEELIRAAPDLDAAGCSPLPWSLTEALRASLGDLSDAEREVAEAAAVLGVDARFDLFAGVLGRDERYLLDALRGLVDRGLMIEPDPDRFAFRHNLVAEAIADGMLSRQRRLLHQRAVELLLAADPPDHAGLARHAGPAGRWDDLVVWARVGSQEALAAGSTYQALQLSEAGLDEEPDDLELLEVASRSAWLVGARLDAVDYATRRLRLAEALGETGAAAASRRLLVRLAWEREETEREYLLVAELVDGLDDLDEHEQARVIALVAQHHMLAGRTDAAVEWADRAIAVAEDLGETVVRAQALIEKGSALICERFVEDGLQVLFEGIEEAAAVGDHVQEARGLFNVLGCAHVDLDDRRAVAARMRRAADRAGFTAVGGPWYHGKLADVALSEGDLGLARQHLALVSGSSVHAVGLAALALEAVIEAGEVERAAELLEGSLAEGLANPNIAWPTWLGHVVVAARTGRRDVLVSRLQRLPVADSAWGPTALALALRDLRTAGIGLPELHELCEHVRRADDRRPLVLTQPWATSNSLHLADAELAAARRSADLRVVTTVLAAWSDDLDEAREGLAELEGLGPFAARPNLLAEVDMAVAEAEARAGELVAARGLADRAVERLSRWDGPRRAAAFALAERLRRPGAIRSGEDVGADECEALTPREREIAALLATGMSNGELAERLFISPKTVSVHVSNILGKLGMGSRTEVAAWAVRTGLAPSSAA